MGPFKLVFLMVVTFGILTADNPTDRQILYTLQTGDFEHALELYQELRESTGKHNMELVQQIGLVILDRGFRSKDEEINLLTLLGAGISTSERCLYILESGLNSANPQVQLMAMNFLCKQRNDRADAALHRALGCNNILARLEILHYFAEIKHPNVVHQLDALMCKLDPQLHVIFPQLYALAGTTEAIRNLKRLLAHTSEQVRVAAILSTARYSRDDLLPQIRKLASHHENIQQEACAYALGVLHDETSIPRLTTLAQSPVAFVRLAALEALYKLGQKERRIEIEAIAKKENLHAVYLLGEMAGSEETLYQLTQSENGQVRINASLALLKRQDDRCLAPIVIDILVHDSRDLAFTKVSSPSGALTAWRAIPSASQNLKDTPIAHELSLAFREDVLVECLELSPEAFLKMAKVLFESQQNPLIPALVELLENSSSKDAIALLKQQQQRAGAPLIRNYCNLALFNLKEAGPYEENLRDWITKQNGGEMISMRPYVPWEARDPGEIYELNPQDTSRLLISSFESFAKTQDDKGIDVLIEALRYGNGKNRFALAGLLVRSTM